MSSSNLQLQVNISPEELQKALQNLNSTTISSPSLFSSSPDLTTRVNHKWWKSKSLWSLICFISAATIAGVLASVITDRIKEREREKEKEKEIQSNVGNDKVSLNHSSSASPVTLPSFFPNNFVSDNINLMHPNYYSTSMILPNGMNGFYMNPFSSVPVMSAAPPTLFQTIQQLYPQTQAQAQSQTQPINNTNVKIEEIPSTSTGMSTSVPSSSLFNPFSATSSGLVPNGSVCHLIQNNRRLNGVVQNGTCVYKVQPHQTVQGSILPGTHATPIANHYEPK